MYRKAYYEVSESETICHPWNAGWLQVHHFTLSGRTSIYNEGVLLIKKKLSIFLIQSFLTSGIQAQIRFFGVEADSLVYFYFLFQWIFNLLEHKAEMDRIIFDDADPKNGFVLAPDLKWDGTNLANLYVLAIIRRKGIKSVR